MQAFSVAGAKKYVLSARNPVPETVIHVSLTREEDMDIGRVHVSLMKNPVITGSVGGVIGLLAGVMIGNSSVDGKLNAAMEDALAPVAQSNATQSSAMEALSERIEALEGQLAEGASASSELAGSLGSQLEALRDSIGGAISETATEQSTALQTALEDMRSQISSQAEALKEAAVSATAGVREAITEKTDAPEPEPADEASDDGAKAEPIPSGSADALGVGQTGVFADGAVRAFVNRIDEDGAILTINRETSTVGAGESIVVRHEGGTCRVGVGEITANGAEITSDCDGPLVPEGGVTAVPGQTVALADGALRVFVSGIIGGDARLAVNTLATEVVAVGESASVDVDGQVCSVTVTGVRGSEVGLTGSCG